MTQLARLGVQIDTRSVDSSVASLDRFGVAGDNAARKADGFAGVAKKGFGAVAIAASAALGAMMGIGSAISTIREFETSMSKLGAITGATGGQMSAMRDIARDLGATTEFSATQAADGLTFLGMAGFNAAESMAAIPAVLDLATASGLGLASAADIASNIMSGFGIAAENSAEVTDILAAASSRANTDVGQLGSAMSTVAPISAALGIELADTAAAIGVLSDAGIQGERAGTALRGVLASLAGPTTEAERVLKSIGLTIADVDPATNSLSDVMGKLGAAGLTTADAMTIFGREAASGALVMVKGAEQLGDFGNELRNVDGAAADMAATMRDNLGGDIDGLMSAVSGLMLSLGDAGLTAILRGVVSGLTAITRAVSSVVDTFASAVGWIGDFTGLTRQLSNATDNVTLAMGDEIGQANALFTLMGSGATMTQSAALAKLSEAEAHLRNADALRQETQEIIALQQAQLTVDYQMQMDALSTIREGTDAYHERQESIVSILNQMDELQSIQTSTNGEYAAAVAEVERIREAIAGAVDGMVTFDGEVITANDLTERLAATAGGINFNSAEASAARLAAQLGVSLEIAGRLNALGPQMSEGGAGGGRGGDPREMGGSALDWQVREADAFTAAYVAPRVSTRGGGGSRRASGGGGGASSAAREAQREMNELQREAEQILKDLMTPQDEFNEAIEQASRLLDAGVLPLDKYTEHVDRLNQEFVEQAWKDSGFAEITDQLIDAALGADGLADAFEAMRTVALNAIADIAAEMFKAGVRDLFMGLIGGSSGTGGASVAGAPVPADVTNLVGKSGPSSSGMSTSNHKRGGSAVQSGGNTYHIDARGSQEGVADQIVAAIKAYDKTMPSRVKGISKDMRAR